MTSLGFENYGEALKIYLARYREVSIPVSPACFLAFLVAHANPSQNLVARGEQKPIAGSSAGPEGYEAANHNVLSAPLDPSGEAAAEFGYPPGSHVAPGEY